MATPFIGQISMTGHNFAPSGWALCNGQLISISQNNALFALIGTTYGGDGVNTFALPNLQSQLSVHQGQGPGLSPYVIGQTSGNSSVTLTQSMIPVHSHTLNTTTAAATAAAIANTLLPATPTVTGAALYSVAQSPPAPALQPQTMAAGSCGTTGGSQPHNNLMPSLCITFIIALAGVFPSQN